MVLAGFIGLFAFADQRQRAAVERLDDHGRRVGRDAHGREPRQIGAGNRRARGDRRRRSQPASRERAARRARAQPAKDTFRDISWRHSAVAYHGGCRSRADSPGRHRGDFVSDLSAAWPAWRGLTTTWAAAPRHASHCQQLTRGISCGCCQFRRWSCSMYRERRGRAAAPPPAPTKIEEATHRSLGSGHGRHRAQGLEDRETRRRLRLGRRARSG